MHINTSINVGCICIHVVVVFITVLLLLLAGAFVKLLDKLPLRQDASDTEPSWAGLGWVNVEPWRLAWPQ